jgi:hypothetical protein
MITVTLEDGTKIEGVAEAKLRDGRLILRDNKYREILPFPHLDDVATMTSDEQQKCISQGCGGLFNVGQTHCPACTDYIEQLVCSSEGCKSNLTLDEIPEHLLPTRCPACLTRLDQILEAENGDASGQCGCGREWRFVEEKIAGKCCACINNAPPRKVCTVPGCENTAMLEGFECENCSIPF